MSVLLYIWSVIKYTLIFLYDVFLLFAANWWSAPLVFACFFLFGALHKIYVKCRKSERKSTIRMLDVLFIGTFASAFCYLAPLYTKQYDAVTSVFVTIQHAFRLFALDGEFIEHVIGSDFFPSDYPAYRIPYGSFLYFFAPLLTFTFILSFFKNFLAFAKYNVFFLVETHVFSELNDKSLALAKSIYQKKKPFLGIFPRALIVFTDIIDKKEEIYLDLIDDARTIGAILFRKDLESVRFKHLISVRKLNFYLISQDEPEKIRHAEGIINNYDRKMVKLYIFSDDIRMELFLMTVETKRMVISRINDIRALIYHNLYEHGVELFKRARAIEDMDKVISVVIVGLGKYGNEMLKTLTWFCQLPGYKLKINAFDTDPNALKKLKAECPELLSKKYNQLDKPQKGEAQYEIHIHPGIDVTVPDFEKRLAAIDDATYIFVCLGDDEANLTTAKKICSICERTNYKGDQHKPDIETIVYDSNLCAQMAYDWDGTRTGIKTTNGRAYKILMTGDLENFYAHGTVIESALEKEGEAIHIRYAEAGDLLAFTANHMQTQWDEFLCQNGLQKAWFEYEKTAKSDSDLSTRIAAFAFMTEAESYRLKTANESECHKIDAVVKERKELWNRIVTLYVHTVMEDKTNQKLWKPKQKKLALAAKKTFHIEYNYHSSVAKALHIHSRRKLPVKSELIYKSWQDMSLEEMVTIGEIEHVRWNAYMRTEGFRYAPERNDLAQQHHNLVPVKDLTVDDLRKDA